MALICNRCGETFTLEEYNKMKNKLEVRPIIGGEEASELAQAALKLRRALDGTNPTPKSVDECLENIQEEMADVFVCLTMFGKSAERDEILIYNRYMEKVVKIEDEKEARWLSRLEAKENKNG